MNKIFILFLSFVSAIHAESEEKNSDLKAQSGQIEEKKLQEAQDVIQKVSQKTQDVFLRTQETDLQGSGDKIKKQKEALRILLQECADIQYIARIVFPQKKLWKTLSQKQKEKYFKIFGDEIINTYYTMLKTKHQKKIALDIKKAVRIPRKQRSDFFRVETTFNSTPPVNLTWMLTSQMKIIDLNVEGASLTHAKKKEYKSLARQCMGPKGKIDFDLFLSKIQQ